MKTAKINLYGLKFCRIMTVLLLATAIIFKIKILVFLTFILMLIPAIFTVHFSPFYVFYLFFLKKLFPEKITEVEIAAIRFAQGFGASLLFIALYYLYIRNTAIAGWLFTGTVALATAFGASGLCIGAAIFYFFRNIYRKIWDHLQQQALKK